MSERIMPCYPVYIPSKGRSDVCFTAKCLDADGVPFQLVVEPQEADAYIERFGADRVLVLPFSNLGLGSIPARNFIWQHARERGAARHWVLDDNLRYFARRYRAKRLYCDAGIALRVCEDFSDRYTNIAISGLNYRMFVPDYQRVLPVQINCHVYSCILLRTDLDFSWRGRYNEDTDLCLQVLSAGYCTVLLNTFLVEKVATMTMKGGNSEQLYQGDGRLKMARSLERMWPGVVTTQRRYGRPQHVVRDNWRRFDTRLQLRDDVDLSQLQANEYGMSLMQMKQHVKSDLVRQLLDTWREEQEHS